MIVSMHIYVSIMLILAIKWSYNSYVGTTCPNLTVKHAEEKQNKKNAT